MRKLGTDLLRHGVGVWFDEWDIQPGDSITGRISEGLSRSDVFILVISPQSLKSKWVQKELRAALYRQETKRNFRFIPVVRKKVSLEKIPALIGDMKYVNFDGIRYADGLQAIIAAVCGSTNKPPVLVNAKFVEAIAGFSSKEYLQKNAYYYHMAAAGELHQGKYDDAIPLLENALRLWPNYTSAQFDLGNIYARTGKYSKAIASYRAVARLDKSHASAFAGLGFLLARQGKYSDAIKCYKRVYQLDSQNATTLHDLGMLSHRLLRYKDAAYYYHEHLILDPQNLIARIWRAEALIEIKRYAEAEIELKIVLATKRDVLARRMLVNLRKTMRLGRTRKK